MLITGRQPVAPEMIIHGTPKTDESYAFIVCRALQFTKFCATDNN